MLAASLSACSLPWTIRPIGGDSQTHTKELAPAAYASSIWSSRLLPTLLKSATDARTLLDALSVSVDSAGQRYGHREGSGAWYFAIRGRGLVLAEDSASRARTVDIDIAPANGKPDISLEIGPVLRGTAVRDATGLVPFTNFTTQLQYADVGNALNDIVLKSALKPFASGEMRGRTVDFVAVFSAQTPWQPPIRDAIPVQLTMSEGHP